MFTSFTSFSYIFSMIYIYEFQTLCGHLHIIYDALLTGFIYGEVFLIIEKEILINNNFVQLRVLV